MIDFTQIFGISFKNLNFKSRPKTIEELTEREEKRNKEYGKQFPENTKQSEASIKSSTTEGKLYFVALTTLDRLDIQFVPELNLGRQANIAKIQIIGRNEPLHQFTGGESTLTFQLDFYAKDEDRLDVIKKVRWLESLTYNDGYKRPAQKVKLVFGDLFTSEIWVVNNVTTKLSNFNREKGFLPQQAYVDISLMLDTETNSAWEDIRLDNNTHLM